MKIRAGFLGACPYPVPQGSQVFMRDHALAFQEAGHIAHLITYGHGIGEDTSGLPHHRGPHLPGARRTAAGPSFYKPLLDLGLLWTVKRVVRQERLSVIFAHNYEALIVALAARACPVIYHAHNIMADELPHYYHDAMPSRRAGHWFDATFPKRAHAVLAPHAPLRACLVALGCREETTFLVPPPVDIDLFQHAEFGQELPVIVYAGNLDRYQNLDLLVAAFGRLKKRHPGARLLVGTAQEGKLPGATMIATPDIPALAHLLDRDAIFALPRTSWSGYPVKLLNARAAGLPVVACASAAHGLQHGHDALIVPDNDLDAFTQALEQLLVSHEQRAQMGVAARASVLAAHCPIQAGETLAKIAANLINK